MAELIKLTKLQQNILIASIIADGEITKIYPNSRRKNNSYREHYGINQKAYREWKQSFFPELLYLTPKSNTLRSASLPLFTQLYDYFYDEQGNKQIPASLLHLCNDISFLAILYLDDGTLSITKRINHLKKRIYLTPHISLALQSFPLNQLENLRKHIEKQFCLNFSTNKRQDGHGYILRFTSVGDTMQYLTTISPFVRSCDSMRYKTDWGWRLQQETIRLNKSYPDYEVLTSDRKRQKPYSEEEIAIILSMLAQHKTHQQIADQLGRTYWAIVAKIAELRKSIYR